MKNEKGEEIAQIKYEIFGKGPQERTTKSQGRLKTIGVRPHRGTEAN